MVGGVKINSSFYGAAAVRLDSSAVKLETAYKVVFAAGLVVVAGTVAVGFTVVALVVEFY